MKELKEGLERINNIKKRRTLTIEEQEYRESILVKLEKLNKK